MKKKPVVVMVVTALLSAVAVALFYMNFSIFPPPASHLKLDFSDIPVLFGGLLFGPGTAVVIELIKNLIELLTVGAGSTMGLGNIMNFTVGVAFALPYVLIIRRAHKRQQATSWKTVAIASAAGIAAIIAVGIGMNVIFTPLYFRFVLNNPIPMSAVWGVVGFATALNTIKGVMLSVSGALLLRLPLKARLEKYISGNG